MQLLGISLYIGKGGIFEVFTSFDQSFFNLLTLKLPFFPAFQPSFPQVPHFPFFNQVSFLLYFVCFSAFACLLILDSIGIVMMMCCFHDDTVAEGL
jgi:hypothetical protein